MLVKELFCNNIIDALDAAFIKGLKTFDPLDDKGMLLYAKESRKIKDYIAKMLIKKIK